MTGSGEQRSDFQMYVYGNTHKDTKDGTETCVWFDCFVFRHSPFKFHNHVMKQIYVATLQHLADGVCNGMPKLMFSMDFLGGNVYLTSERILGAV